MGNAAIKKLRRPPTNNVDLQTWVEGPSASEHQVTKNPADAHLAGPGIVKRANGAHRRRLVVYIEPERARQLKAAAALDGQDMSEIVDQLIGDWLRSRS